VLDQVTLRVEDESTGAETRHAAVGELGEVVTAGGELLARDEIEVEDADAGGRQRVAGYGVGDLPVISA
jgi:hypothetical protein